MVHIHFDLETGSLLQNAAIFSIGAVAINPNTGETLSEFHVRIDPECYENKGRVFDNLWWWEEANQDELNLIRNSEVTLMEALDLFAGWLIQFEHSAPYYWQKRWLDVLWLESAYSACAMPTPVYFSNVLELCTFFWTKGYTPITLHENAHNALADAKAQAENWIKANRYVKQTAK